MIPRKRKVDAPAPPGQVAVVAHAGKTFGGGLQELRKVLDAAGHQTPLWYEVQKSKKAPRAVRRALRDGADLVYVWGGDGMVQHCVDAMADADRKVPIAILPAGTANLLANNLGIPIDLEQAVELGLTGIRQALDVGVVNGERFAVMAGTGVDAMTMRDVSTEEKEQLGDLAYFRSGVNALRKDPVMMTIRVNGKTWFTGEASCVLVGNVGTITGGMKPFPDASPVDGKLELAVVTATSKMDWARVFARLATGHADRSPFVRTTRATKIVVALEKEAPYELDGGARGVTSKLKFRVEPGAITVCVPVALSATRRSPKKVRPRLKVRTAQAAHSRDVVVEPSGVAVDSPAAVIAAPDAAVDSPAAVIAASEATVESPVAVIAASEPTVESPAAVIAVSDAVIEPAATVTSDSEETLEASTAPPASHKNAFAWAINLLHLVV